MTYDDVIEALHDLADASVVAARERKFGIKSQGALGITHRDLNVLVREIGKDNDLALQLYDSGIYEGKLLCSKIFRPKDVTDALCEKWIADFDNWEICDSFCMAQVAKSPVALSKIEDWTQREKEFEKRAGFATMAAYCMAEKKAQNATFEAFLPLIEKGAADERYYVKKAVSWALRGIGKRNRDLQVIAIETAELLAEREEKPARWIAKDVLRELTGEKVRMSDYPRSIYRK